MSDSIRLQKFIADCGYTSRRKAEELILQGRVEVNGDVVTELGTKVDPSADAVVVDGQSLDVKSVKKVYMVINKPRGYMTTLSDPEGRKTVMDLVKEVSERIYPIGRLDYLSEGLLIMTNDGEVANMIMHPKYEITKVYEVKVFGAVNEKLLKNLRAGTYLDGQFVKPKSVRVIKQLPTKTWLEFRLQEGRNREIRRICEEVGLTVDKLKRIAIEGLTVEGIAPGKFRYLSKKDLFSCLGLNRDGEKIKDVEFFSEKKTVSLKKKGVQEFASADDQMFKKFRKDQYFESIKNIKESKQKTLDKLKAEAKQETEDRRIARVQRKQKREDFRRKEKAGAHAKFVK